MVIFFVFSACVLWRIVSTGVCGVLGFGDGDDAETKSGVCFSDGDTSDATEAAADGKWRHVRRDDAAGRRGEPRSHGGRYNKGNSRNDGRYLPATKRRREERRVRTGGVGELGDREAVEGGAEAAAT